MKFDKNKKDIANWTKKESIDDNWGKSQMTPSLH